MGIQKGNKTEVEEFKFGQLVPSSSESGEVSTFSFDKLNPADDFKKTISAESIRQERENEISSGFTIDQQVREHRGLRNQEVQDFENRVESEIERRLEKRIKQAYEEGFQSGLADGEKKAYDDAMSEHEQRILSFEGFLEELMSEKKAIIEGSKTQAYSLINKLTKWIVLKEVEDKEYIERLLEKLILEINTKSNLLIKVNQADFEAIPDVIKKVETRLGSLSNIRVEVGNELSGRGLVLESEVGVIDGSLKAQMKSLDKIFETVGVNASEDSNE